MSNEQIHTFCKENKKSFIAIVWPIAEGKHQEIVSLLDSHGKIVYEMRKLLNPQKAFIILKKSHYNCPQVTDFKKHLKWYFPSNELFKKPARIFVCLFDTTDKATQCKYAIRKLFNLSYRSIHINDTHSETCELVQLLF